MHDLSEATLALHKPRNKHQPNIAAHAALTAYLKHAKPQAKHPVYFHHSGGATQPTRTQLFGCPLGHAISSVTQLRLTDRRASTPKVGE